MSSDTNEKFQLPAVVHDRKVPIAVKAAAAQDAVCELLASGWSVFQTAKKLGLRDSTIHKWRQKCPEFSRAIQEARETGRLAVEDRILQLSEVPYNDGRESRARVDIATVLEKHMKVTYPERYQSYKHDIRQVTVDFGPMLSRSKAQAKEGEAIDVAVHSVTLDDLLE